MGDITSIGVTSREERCSVVPLITPTPSPVIYMGAPVISFSVKACKQVSSIPHSPSSPYLTSSRRADAW